MRNFNRKDYNDLKPYEGHLTRGYKGRYVYAMRRKDFDFMYNVYKSLGYEKRLDYSCNSCVLELTATLGELYYQYQERMEEKTMKAKENAKTKKD